MKTYRTADNPTRNECAALGIEYRTAYSWTQPPRNGRYIKAVRTDEFRAPKAGEWYLSGCNEQGNAEAWRAPNDLSAHYHIARLVIIDRQTKITEKIEV